MATPAVTMEQQYLLLHLYIQPKASRDQWCGIHGDELKLAITAPPVDGKANQHIIKLLSKAFKVPKGSIEIQKGELGRHKQVLIIAPQQLPDAISTLL